MFSLMRTKFALALPLFFWTLSPVASADSLEDMTQCQNASKQAAETNSSLQESQRQALFDDLFTQIISVRELLLKGDESLSKSYLSNCLSLKIKAFEKNYSSAASSFRERSDIMRKYGELEEIQGNRDKALKLYELAVGKDPQNADLRMRHFKLWADIETGRVRKQSSQGSMSTQELNKYLSKMKELLQPIIEQSNAPTPLRIEALKIRANIYLKLSKTLEAIEDFKQILKIDAQDKDSLEMLASYQVNRKNWLEAKSVLERLVKINPVNADALLSLLKLQIDFEEFMAANLTSLKGVENFPKNNNIKALRAQVLFHMGRDKESGQLLNEVLASDAKNQYALNLSAKQIEKQGDAYISRGLTSNALKNYQDASQLLKDDPKTVRRIFEKMAILIFEHQKGLGFTAGRALQVDMDRIVELLQSSLSEPDSRPSAKVVQTYLEAALRSSQPGRNSSTCNQLRSGRALQWGIPREVLATSCR